MIIELQSRKDKNKYYYPTQQEWEMMQEKGLNYNWKCKIISNIPEPRIQNMPHIEIIEYRKKQYDKMNKAELLAECERKGIECSKKEKNIDLINKLTQ